MAKGGVPFWDTAAGARGNMLPARTPAYSFLSHFGTPGRKWTTALRAIAKRQTFFYNLRFVGCRMKKNILLVNCYREKAEDKIKGYHNWLNAGAAAAGLELSARDAGDHEPLPIVAEFTAVIVTGSQKMVGDGEIDPGLLEFLRGNRWPLLGICYGHQVLARAFGCLVKRDERKHLGEEEIFLNKTNPLFSAFPPMFKMSESHEEIVMRDYDLEKEFMVLAESRYGLVEAIRHREYPLFGVQFHPEKSGELGVRLLMNFLKMIP